MGRSKRNKCCPRCGSDDVLLQDMLSSKIALYVCLECDKEFEVGGHIKKQFDEIHPGLIEDDLEFPSYEDEETW